jgi:hypothetical protein
MGKQLILDDASYLAHQRKNTSSCVCRLNQSRPSTNQQHPDLLNGIGNVFSSSVE